MQYYPAFLDISNRSCLVVGGGAVGLRKVKTLLKCGANVSVVSPQADAQMAALAQDGKIVFKKRSYCSSDMDGTFLVVGATDDEKLNIRISKDADSRNILCNIVDRPEACSFILPALVHRGDLLIAISTSGKSPALAKKLRMELEQEFGEEYALFLVLMGAIRKKMLQQGHAPLEHKRLFERLVNSEILEMLIEKRHGEIDAVLKEILGDGYAFKALTQPMEPSARSYGKEI